MPWTACVSHSSPSRHSSHPRATWRPPRVLDNRTVAIPERPGNLRADTFRNVLQQHRVGLIFLVPGKSETLRVSGTAGIARDVWLRERMAVAGRLPELALVVTVEEPFMHCTKCVVRSQM
jgi:uncharacterized protein